MSTAEAQGTLSEIVAAATQRAEQIEQSQKGVDSGARYDKIAQHLSELSADLLPAVKEFATCRRAGIEVDASIDWVCTIASDLASSANSGLIERLGEVAQASRSKAKQNLEPLKQGVRAAWSTRVQAVLKDRGAAPSWAELVTMDQALAERMHAVERKLQTLTAPTDDGVRALREAQEVIAEAKTKANYSPEVSAFLKAVVEGAPLSLLTPAVLGWLHETGRENDYRVRRQTGGYGRPGER